MSITYVTLAIPGKHSQKSISQLLAPMMMLAKQAFGIVATHNRRANTVEELPHAFTKFDTANQCANDTDWNERAVGTKEDTRLSLSEIRTLQLFANHKRHEMEGENLHP